MKKFDKDNAASWPSTEQTELVPSQRGYRVIELVAEGLNNKEVAEAIGTTEHVVKNYLKVIYDKLGLWSRLELALRHESRRGASVQ